MSSDTDWRNQPADPDAEDRLQIHLDVATAAVSAAELTAILGVDADYSINRGDPRRLLTADVPGYSRKHTESLWSITSGPLGPESVDEHLERLWTRASIALPRVHDIPGTVSVTLAFHHRMDGRAYQGHGLWLPSDWVALLGAAGGSVDIDQYVSDSGPDE
jgi:hypothetical protein